MREERSAGRHPVAYPVQVCLGMEGESLAPMDLKVADTDRASIEALQPVDAAKERALARATRTDDCNDLPLANIEGEAIEDHLLAKAHGEVLHAQNWSRRL